MRSLTILWAICLATGCMNFDWPDNQISCVAPQNCPIGMHCNLELEKCIGGLDPSGEEPCQSAADCSAKECGVAICNSRSVCEWTVDHQLCPPGDLCTAETFVCENALCPGATLTEPALYDNSIYNPSFMQLASHVDGYVMSFADDHDLNWSLAGAAGSRTSTYQIKQSGAVESHDILALGDGGFALVYNSFVDDSWDVYIQMLGPDGSKAGDPVLVSIEDTAPDTDKASYRAKAAYAPSADGNGGTIGIVWLHGDFDGSEVSNGTTWGAVFDVKSQVVSPNFPLADQVGAVDEALVSVFDEVFFSTTVSDSKQIFARVFDSAGPKAQAPILVIAAGADSPHALAWDGASTLGLLWRHQSSAGGVMRFASINAEGTLLDLENNPTDLGPALDEETPKNRTGADLAWADTADGGAGHWIAVFDGVPDEPSGDPEMSESWMALIPADQSPLPAPINLSDYPVSPSFAPQVALRPNTSSPEALIAWIDRRPFSFEPDTETSRVTEFPQGIFFRILSCP